MPALQSLPWPSPFKIGLDGVYKTEEKESGEKSDIWVCSPLWVEARTCDADGQDWGLQLLVESPSGHRHSLTLPMSMLAGNGQAFRELLFGMGLRVALGRYKDLHQYLVAAQPTRLLKCVKAIGWHEGVYVLPDACYGQGEELVLRNSLPDTLFKVKGNLAEWQDRIGRYCQGNSRLIMACSVAVAATLLKVCGFESGGFHLMGNSSTGKSTALLVAGSVCGGGGRQGFVRRWRATDNALEQVALAHNDNLLCLDEIGQLAPKTASEVAYMLANEHGKARAAKDGSMRAVTEWRLLFLSSGEISLEQKVQEDGRRYMAGQAVRIVTLPADAGVGLGLFEHLHGFRDAKGLAEHLQASAQDCYGAPLRAFLTELTRDPVEHKKRLMRLIEVFEKTLNPEADGQVRRVGRRLALVAAAGELAITWNIFPWPGGQALADLERCLKDWMLYRGGTGAAEKMTALAQVKSFIAQHGQSRFEPWDDGDHPVPNRVGFRRDNGVEVHYLVFPEAFKSILCAGLNHHEAARWLIEAGYLEPDPSGGPGRVYKLPREGTCARLYTIKSNILGYDF